MRQGAFAQREGQQILTRAGTSLVTMTILAALISGCTTAESLTPAATAGASNVQLPDTTDALPVAAMVKAGGNVVAETGRAAAEGAEAIAAPVLSLASTAAGSAAAILDDVTEGASDTRLDRLIAAYAGHYDVPETLVRRVVKRESNFRPEARNGPYWGLMQIRHDTARGMGYRGPASGLLDAETNLKYAVRYLRGAYLVARGNQDQAVRFYARGYYYDAKRAGLLDETGLGRDRRRMR